MGASQTFEMTGFPFFSPLIHFVRLFSFSFSFNHMKNLRVMLGKGVASQGVIGGRNKINNLPGPIL